jgi:hypothetical protein
MSPRHFSSKYGPYFVNDGFSKQNDPMPTTRVSFIDRVKAFFKSRPKKRHK